MAVIVPDYGSGDKVSVTNTGDHALVFKAGSLLFLLFKNETRPLDRNYVDIYQVKASDTWNPSSGPPPPPPDVDNMTTIAEITYQSDATFTVTKGDTIVGAKFSSQVPMADAESSDD